MATSNKAVTTYLPPHIEESLTQYCVNQGLTRRGRDGESMPSLGTGIVEVLKDYFQISEDGDTGLSKRLEQYFESSLSSKVQDLVRDLVSDHKQPDLLGRIVALEEKVRHLEPEKVQDSSNSAVIQDSHPGQLELLSQPPQQLEEKLLIKPISGLKLSELRFGLSKSTVAGRKRSSGSPKEFAEWTGERDPDGIRWKSVESPSKGYLPCDDLPGDVQSKLLAWIRDNVPESLGLAPS